MWKEQANGVSVVPLPNVNCHRRTRSLVLRLCGLVKMNALFTNTETKPEWNCGLAHTIIKKIINVIL